MAPALAFAFASGIASHVAHAIPESQVTGRARTSLISATNRATASVSPDLQVAADLVAEVGRLYRALEADLSELDPDSARILKQSKWELYI